ncbi:MAG: hypothetical protein SFY80_15975 [Verrucomicrobiota bacterium]|nr:hypothetical protein [Verrucomicrobiota bacterium]
MIQSHLCLLFISFIATPLVGASWVQLLNDDLGSVNALDVANSELRLLKTNDPFILSTADLVTWTELVKEDGKSPKFPTEWSYVQGDPFDYTETSYKTWYFSDYRFVYENVVTCHYKMMQGNLYTYKFRFWCDTIGETMASGSTPSTQGPPTYNSASYPTFLHLPAETYVMFSQYPSTIVYRFRHGEKAQRMEVNSSTHGKSFVSNTGRYYLYTPKPPAAKVQIVYLDENNIRHASDSFLATLPNYDANIKFFADDGEATIITNRAYSNDSGATWTYYEFPLPCDYVSYAAGVFEYTAAPSSNNTLTEPIRARSSDQGKTWQEVGFHETLRDYTLQVTWLADIGASELSVTKADGAAEVQLLNGWQVLDTVVFNDSFVVLTKSSTTDQRRLFVYVLEPSLLTIIPKEIQPLVSDELWNFACEDQTDALYFPLDSMKDRSSFVTLALPIYATNPIYGLCDVSNYPWIINAELGGHAFFKAEAPTPAAFLWEIKHDWLYTKQEWFPFLWSFKYENWIWIDAGKNRTHHWFLYLGNDEWRNLTLE